MPLRALLVDDSATVRMTCRRLLSEIEPELRFFEASSGEAAIELVREIGVPDFVVMDFQMPGMDGAECLGKLRARGFVGAAILLTSEKPGVFRQELLGPSECNYLQKPGSGPNDYKNFCEVFSSRARTGLVRAHLRTGQVA